MGREVSKRKKKIGNIVGICVCSALIIFAFCGQYFQSFLRDVANVFVGAFGMSFYGIMAAIIVACSFSLAGKKMQIPGKYLAHFVLLFVFTVLLVQLWTTSYLPTDFKSFAHYVYHFYDGVPTFGGLIFGIIVFAFKKTITDLGAYILIVGMIVFDAVMIGLFFYNYHTGKLTLEASSEKVYEDVPAETPGEQSTPFSDDDQRQKAISLLFDQTPSVYPAFVANSFRLCAAIDLRRTQSCQSQSGREYFVRRYSRGRRRRCKNHLVFRRSTPRASQTQANLFFGCRQSLNKFRGGICGTRIL